MRKLSRALRSISKPAAFFVALVVIYYCWMTGFTIRFSEVSVFPTYNMLATSFLKGQLNIDEIPPVDFLAYKGKTYLYFGPGPAIFHIPSLVLAGKQTPTGLMVIIFLAGATVVFRAILNLWQPQNGSLGVETGVFSLLFAFNGYSLLMAAIPSIHHEAICSGMFFLLVGIYYVLKSARHGFAFDLTAALVSGSCFCMCVLSRSSYVFTVAFMVLVMIVGKLKYSKEPATTRSLLPALVLAFMAFAGIAGMLGYNCLRFGNPVDFGVGFMQTLYRDYFSQGNYLRYDHIPYNIWDYFFRIPQLAPDFPYIKLPFHILEVKSFRSANYFLIHVNELSTAVFVFMPVLIFCFFCNSRWLSTVSGFDRIAPRVLLASFVLQVVPLSLTIGSIARYYFDFLPIMLIMAFAGYVGIKSRLSPCRLILGLTSVLSLILSLSVPISALIFYWSFIKFKSPLLELW
jgi:hypothetical protein